MKTKLLLLLLLLNFSIYAQMNIPSYVPKNGLIAYYPFNGNANDESGNQNNGSVNGTTLTADRLGNLNSAYSFDGLTNYIDATISLIPQNNASRTISGWFQTNTPNFSKNNETCIFNYGTLSKLQRFSLCIYSKGYLETVNGPDFSDNDFYVNNFDYLNNNWYFFTLTYDGNNVSLYVNGIKISQKTVSLSTANNLFRIGKRISGDTINEYFKGKIDDIGVWNRVLTPEEILVLYTPGEPEILYTLIPDSNFEQKLINLGIDTDGLNGKVLTYNVSTVKFLDLAKSNISDLTGIQDFVSLTDLYCGQNSLTTLNISKNTALTTLDCNNNKITSLDISNNIALLNLSCYGNQLTTLDVKVNTALTKLDSGSNKYTTLDVSSNTALTFLGCNTSQLASLDVSKNTALNLLDCRENKLTHLDVSKITTLTELYCQSNQLTDMDISKNKALEFLNCSKNQLTTLDVSVNTALVGLYANSNQLTSLNLKNANNVKFAYLNLKDNPNLSCIQIDDRNYFNTNWTDKKDAAASFNTNCTIEYVLLPDNNFEQKLIDLGIDTDGLNGKITIGDISAITTLNLSNSNIKDLTGIENFTALTYLDCSNNQITSLNLSQNVLLETLNVSSNQITSLDLSKNNKLTIVYVVSNPLEFLNLQNGNNKNIIIANETGKTTANILKTTFLGFNKLGCVKVDDPVFSNTNWSKIKEPATVYSATCSLGIEESIFDKVVIYPNPTKGEININNATLEKVSIYNTLGQLVKSFTLDSGNTNNTINLSGLSRGVYYIYLINQDVASAKKVVVE